MKVVKQLESLIRMRCYIPYPSNTSGAYHLRKESWTALLKENVCCKIKQQNRSSLYRAMLAGHCKEHHTAAEIKQSKIDLMMTLDERSGDHQSLQRP